ncbi:MAG: DUF4416 family protein [Candidatus Aminicenantales bacterium]
MAEAKPFTPVKLICGIIYSEPVFLDTAKKFLIRGYGPLDSESQTFNFTFTDYYQKEMGENLKRKFLSFTRLFSPERLSEIKIRTNSLEEKVRKIHKVNFRAVNLDPGYLTRAALIMATVKDFSHRVALNQGIYAHLELLFSGNRVRTLEWTYPDFRTEEYQEYFLAVRKIYLEQLKKLRRTNSSFTFSPEK